VSDVPEDLGDHRTGPGVYARLAEEADVQARRHTPPRWIRWAGWALCVALVAGVVAAALRVHPW
jgi:hypothetical protein